MFGKRTKIKYRIMRLGIISVMVAVTALSVSSTIITQTIQLKKVDEELESLSNAYVTNLSTMTDTICMQIESAANNPKLAVEDLSKEETRKILDELIVSTYFKDFSIAERNGQTLNDTDISEREYFKRALDGETYISSPVVRLTDNTITTMVGTLMPDGRVLYGALTTALFSNGLAESNSDNGSRLVLVLDKEGTVIASSDTSLMEDRKNYINDNDDAYKEVSEKMIAGDSGNMTLKVDDEKYGAYYQPIPGSDGWSLCVTGAYKEALTGVRQSILISMGLATFLVLLEVVVAIKVSAKITRSVEYSAQRLDKLSYGDIHSEAEVKYTNDETEDMTNSLSLAVKELQRYINSISESLSNMASGDFSGGEEMEFKGDFIAISDSFKEINSTLGSLITEINVAASEVLTGVRQISNDSAALADGSTKQSTAVEELTTTMSKVAEQASNNARNAKYAAKLSESSTKSVEVHEQELQNMLAAISEVKQKSNEISSIIKTIEDISFQTNILALNASIEAARAGDAGKGFAVVADEVVDLANKSAQAAQDSAALISQTINAVNRGYKAADVSTKKMGEVKAMSRKVNELVAGISQNSNDQATAIEQTTAGIEQISEVVAQNSVTAIHTATACEQLSGQATQLRDKIGKLKV
ncbi:MAG: methyl-accepting chemotaxis protein [Ruminococcus sp.]|nr:methyl-accepting chemotaxis protein [Ruminococcus sp.]